MEPLDPSVVSLAIEAMDAAAFETFGQLALSEVLGVEFEPTGGTQDGGQDGYLRTRRGKPSHFIQISKEKDVRGKISRTLARLAESGRSPDTLTFLTSENFPTRDAFEVQIEKEKGVQLKIHDRTWLALQISKSERLRRVFAERASGAIRSIIDITHAAVQTHTAAERLSVLVYMDAHARSAPQETDLLTIAVDAAIYQSLEGTDPDKGVFKTEDEITAFVEDRFPTVKKRPSLKISTRLDRLSHKKNNPRIRKYTKDAKYCLPYDVRNELSQENESVRRLEVDFLDSVRQRCKSHTNLDDGDEVLRVASAVHAAIIKTFEAQGLNFAASFEDVQKYNDVKTFEFIEQELSGGAGDNTRREVLVDVAIQVIREVFYSGTETERNYIFQLFKLFSVEFVIKGDERVASHFKNLAKHLRLFVGTDVLIRALSESCLHPHHRHTQNTLKILSSAGAKLSITSAVLEEVYTHIIAENKEFEGHYQAWMRHVTIEEARNSDRILIRAFFYAFLEPDRHETSPKSWRNFLDLFGSANWFDRRDSMEDFATYLLKKFDMEYVSSVQLSDGVPDREVGKLKEKITAIKNALSGRNFVRDVLAENDAKMALFVNHQREVRGERIGTSIYGLQTWWLTEEYHVVRAAQDLKIESRFTMHPQFLMNFCVASPGLRTLTEKYQSFFPTCFGLRITDRVGESTLRDFLRKANEAAKQDDAVAGARIRRLSNEILGLPYSPPLVLANS